MQTSDHPATTGEQTRPAKRVLACELCQSRKVKCDRNFPCKNCIKSGAQCVQSHPGPRQRRRRFPERDLLKQISRYEDLLRINNVAFQPLHGPATASRHAGTSDKDEESEDEAKGSLSAQRSDGKSKSKTVIKSEAEFEAKNIWHAMNQRVAELGVDKDPRRDDEDEDSDAFSDALHESEVKEAWNHYKSNDELLFATPNSIADLSSFHPEQLHIFMLWQTYLDNFNPLIKITHTPTLQTKLLKAASDLSNIEPNLEAVMFGIYCVAICTLEDDECKNIFKSPKASLLRTYQFACQQALSKAGFMRSTDRDCLTALVLYLMSIGRETDARSLSSMAASAVRIAQRMKINNEDANCKFSVLEAEMRRRLWWALAIFDARVSEKTDHKDVIIAPVWNCKPPLNVNDFDLRPEMKTAPTVHAEPTESFFVAVRCHLFDYTRHASHHLDFTNPALKSIAAVVRPGSERDDISAWESTMEQRYLKYCNPENPLHFTTLWAARAHLAKSSLMTHFSSTSRSHLPATPSEHNAAVAAAMRMIECDTQLLASPLVRGFRWWFLYNQFPFPAYLFMAQDLRLRPTSDYADRAWNFLSENYAARFPNMVEMEQKNDMFFGIFARIFTQAWSAHEAAYAHLKEAIEPPGIIASIKYRLSLDTPVTQSSSGTMSFSQPVSMQGDDALMTMPLDIMVDQPLPAFDPSMGLGNLPGVPGPGSLGFDINQVDWSAIDWTSLYRNEAQSY